MNSSTLVRLETHKKPSTASRDVETEGDCLAMESESPQHKTDRIKQLLLFTMSPVCITKPTNKTTTSVTAFYTVDTYGLPYIVLGQRVDFHTPFFSLVDATSIIKTTRTYPTVWPQLKGMYYFTQSFF